MKTLRYIVWIVFFLFPLILEAEPYLALREGLKCSACHINRTGGGQRNRMGSGYGTDALPWQNVDLREMKVPHYWSFYEDLIAIGGDFRFSNQTTLIEDNTANSFLTDKANLYLTVRIIPDTIRLYVDESVASGAQNRELFGLLETLPAHGWIKAGRFILPYGLRLEDDRAFIREVTGFNFANPDLGVEIGLEPGNWSFIASMTNGSSGQVDVDATKQFIGTIVYSANAFRVGTSASYNSTDQNDETSLALWGGFRLGPAVFLGEADLLLDRAGVSFLRDQIVAHAEMDYLITKGWNFKATYEFFDPNLDVDEDQRDRVTLGIEPFLAPFIQMGLFYRFNQSIPQNEEQNADEIYLKLHIYF